MSQLGASGPDYTDIRMKYEFIRTIGGGHYGSVRLGAIKGRSSPYFAIKTIAKRKLKAAKQMLEREIQILFALDHPNVIKLYEVFEDHKYFYLVTEYCSGGELFDRILAMGRYSEVEASRLMQKILLAANNLHQNNVCHRDLKPENFMFESPEADSELKLIDFGLSNKFFFRFGSSELNSFVGTPNYIAPEVLLGRYGAMCDMWSVGVIMYAMLSGRFPFSGETPNDVFARVLSGEFSISSEVWENVSPLAIDLLSKLLTSNPSHRLPADKALAHPWLSQSIPANPLAISRDVIDSLRQYKSRSQFQSEAYAIIVKYLTITHIKDLKDTFMALDREKNGFLTFEEVEQGLLTAGYQMAGHEIEEIILNADFRKDGRINYSEFIAATLDSRALLDEDTVWNAFNFFDVDSSGFITESNVREALKRAGRNLSDRDIKSMMTEVGATSEGIGFEEFKQVVKRGNSRVPFPSTAY